MYIASLARTRSRDLLISVPAALRAETLQRLAESATHIANGADGTHHHSSVVVGEPFTLSPAAIPRPTHMHWATMHSLKAPTRNSTTASPSGWPPASPYLTWTILFARSILDTRRLVHASAFEGHPNSDSLSRLSRTTLTSPTACRGTNIHTWRPHALRILSV